MADVVVLQIRVLLPKALVSVICEPGIKTLSKVMLKLRFRLGFKNFTFKASENV